MIPKYLECTTHIGPLARAASRISGVIWDLGAGWYSTPLLHGISDRVISFETDPEWTDKINEVCPDSVVLIRDWNCIWEFPKPSVAFIDCYAGGDRASCAERLLDGGTFIVAHDTEREYWAPIFAAAKYHATFKAMLPWTSYFSRFPFPESLGVKSEQ